MTTVAGIEAAINAGEIEAAINAGEFAQAEGALNPTGGPSAVDHRIRTRLLGVLRYRQGRYKEAASKFERALEDTPDDPLVRLYWATTLHALGRHLRVLEVLPTKATATQPIGFRFLRAQALAALERPEAAYAELVTAQKLFPENTRAPVEMVLLATAEDQIGVAILAAEHLLTLDATRDDLVTAAQLLSPHPRALALMERLTAIFPRDVQLQLAGAYAYANADLPLAAAQRFLYANALDPAVGTWEAADQFLRAGKMDRALYINGGVVDVRRQLSQRLRILFEARQMGRVVAMTRGLVDNGVDDATARYQLAYAHYVLHEPVMATRWARTLGGTELEAAGEALLETLGVASTPKQSP